MSSAQLKTDGGARRNPGPAAIGGIITVQDKEVERFSEYIGETTNNVAEYTALKEGLRRSAGHAIKELDCFLDSELVVRQLLGEYRVKDPVLKQLFREIRELEKLFDRISYSHIPREKNKIADKLVNDALDNQS